MLKNYYPLQMVSMMYEDMYKFYSYFSSMITDFLMGLFSVDELIPPQLKIEPWWVLTMIRTHYCSKSCCILLSI